MNTRLLASDLGFPEGPVVLPDDRLVFCDGNIGELSSYLDGAVSTFAVNGGSALLDGIDGAPRLPARRRGAHCLLPALRRLRPRRNGVRRQRSRVRLHDDL